MNASLELSRTPMDCWPAFAIELAMIAMRIARDFSNYQLHDLPEPLIEVVNALQLRGAIEVENRETDTPGEFALFITLATRRAQ